MCRPASAESLRGFSLTEMAVVLIVVALLVGGMAIPLSAQRDNQLHSVTTAQLALVVDALKGFAAVNRRVPCPAASPGMPEAVAGGACPAASGFLPGQTLGIRSEDAWGRPLRYAVATTYAVGTYSSPPPQPECDPNCPPQCPPSAQPYPGHAATTPGGLLLSMSCLVTDLRACSDGTRHAFIISGPGACPTGWQSLGNGLVVAVWSDGADATTSADDLVAWPSIYVLSMLMKF